MYDPQKIVIMTKLAIYDKYYGSKDRKFDDYFRHDYAYRKNMWTRFFILISSAAVLLLYLVNKIMVDEADIFSIDYKALIGSSASYVFLILIAYTVITSFKAVYDYNSAQKRLDKYYELINMLEGRDGSDTTDKRLLD